MFSGLVESKSRVLEIQQEPGGICLVVDRPKLFDDITLGASISISGCCLTVIAFDDHRMSFQAGTETLSKTMLGQLESGQSVNLERALAFGDRLGGHLVSGHVDGLGKLMTRQDHDEWCDMRFEAPANLLPQMASKGSITVDGVSLTLVDVAEDSFSVALIPHTLQETTLGRLQPGDVVNLETDLLAKYVESQLKAAGR